MKDSDGREHLEECGTFLPAFYEPRSPRGADEEIPTGLADAFAEGDFGRSWRNGETVAVEGGRFHVEVPAGRELGAQKLKLGERSAVTEGLVEGRRRRARDDPRLGRRHARARPRPRDAR